MNSPEFSSKELKAQQVTIKLDNFRTPQKGVKIPTDRSVSQKDSDKFQQKLKIATDLKMKSRSKNITVSLTCFIAAVCCLNPYAYIYLNRRIGLLLFESDLLQLKSSFFSVIFCSIFLVVLILLFILNFNYSNYSFGRRKPFRQIATSKLLGISAIISAISYLSIVLIVPHIKQVQRMPVATFDCEANMIIIENCHQQYTTHDGRQSALDAIRDLFFGDIKITNSNDQIIKKLNCIKYNNAKFKTLQVPTRFLLHNCGLVCEPHKQQVHQFSDDLNVDQTKSKTIVDSVKTDSNAPTTNPIHGTDSLMNAPYDFKTETSATSHVSLKICFSEEFTGGSNYKQFCITNLGNSVNNNQGNDLTVGQLNDMLQSTISQQTITSQSIKSSRDPETHIEDRVRSLYVSRREAINEQPTRYVNPIVQFESHFNNWPHLSSTSFSELSADMSKESGGHSSREDWCKFKPIPPFIINNKPFNEIQCSVEHEYTMTTRSASESNHNVHEDPYRIYLKKSSIKDGESLGRERCNIQCKVNVLYQVHLDGVDIEKNSNKAMKVEATNFYLPLRPCILVSGGGDKQKTSSYYLLFRSIGDTSLFITIILLDLILLLESIDTKQFHFESKRTRVVSSLLVMILVPILVAIAFDLTSDSKPTTSDSLNKFKNDGYLVNLLNERIIPSFYQIIERLTSNESHGRSPYSGHKQNSTSDPLMEQPKVYVELDGYTIPYFVYSILMFALAISSFITPTVSSDTPLVRVSSVEELGMAESDNSLVERCQTKSSTEDANVETLEESESKSDFCPNSHRKSEVVTFALTVLFMGLQFNLSQVVQTHIFLESFGDPSSRSISNYNATKYIIGTRIMSLIIIFTISLVFLDEISSFLAGFVPFKSSATIEKKSSNSKRNKRKLLGHVTVSLLVYSMRYFSLSRLNPVSQYRWFIVLLFQATEFLNFPIIWFALTVRAHEIFMEYSDYDKFRGNKQTPASQSKALDIHIAVQVSLAFTYFVLGRFLALFAHSLHTSIHLHNENVDWFITNYYRSTFETSKLRPPHLTTPSDRSKGNNSFGSDEITFQNYTTKGRANSLFSPLPDERQTYLYASRLFIAYNSLLCFLIGTLLLSALGYTKYRIWAKQRDTSPLTDRTEVGINKSQKSEESIDERLSSDLMRLHPPKTKPIYPMTDGQLKKQKSSLERVPSTRAKILFHYDLGLASSSDGSSNHELDARHKLTDNSIRAKNRPPEGSAETINRTVVHNIDIDLQDNQAEVSDEPVKVESRKVERIVKHRKRRVKIFEDLEDWTSGPETSATENNYDLRKEPKRKKTISFAPTKTLIEDFEAGGFDTKQSLVYDSHPSTTGSSVRTASPEPSVDEGDSDSMNQFDSVDRRN